MYKIFRITYNDGGWHSGALPYFFYIAKNEEDVIAYSRRYQDFIRRQKLYGGDIWVYEASELVDSYDFENLADFNIEITLRKKIDNA